MKIGTQGFDTSDGYRNYEVTDRSVSRALGGLALPIPPIGGCRLVLAGGRDGLLLSEMSGSAAGISGDVSGEGRAGFYTVSVSGCQVIGIFTYEAGRWTNYFFHHCLAGMPNLGHAARAILRPEESVAIVAQLGSAGLESTIDAIVEQVGVPKLNIIGYNAGASAGSIDFGVRLTGGPFGGHFGEIS